MRTTNSLSSAGFILHSYPYKETSLILETFTRSHGRVAMVAKGAKRGNVSSKYALNPFQPLLLDWFGRAELKTLKAAEPERIFPQARGGALMAAFYVNELLLKLAAKDDPHEALFDAYAETLESLTIVQTEAAPRHIEIALRKFELTMLAELGYALTLTHEADRPDAIQPDRDYWYVVDRGPVAVVRNGTNSGNGEMPRALDPVRMSGKTLIAMAANEFNDAAVIAQAKQLMRRVINHHLGDKALHTRQLVRELK
jgi:DNA repair protein RecO (recombination protein O)